MPPSGTLPRPEYPRPQFRRDRWLNLNGPWSFADDPAYGELLLTDGQRLRPPYWGPPAGASCCVWGLSMPNFLPIAPDESRPAALIAQWGPFDFVARWYDRGENPGAEKGLLGAGYTDNPQLYHHASPITHASGPLPPALLIYGRQGQLAHAAWQAAGAHCDLLVLNQIGHCTEGDNRPQREHFLRAASAFLAAQL